ncbi:hypothetical protein DH2020_011169 [Rehmannia glutinosa]|uniref:Protein RETICULATA-RELATED 1, chloroplastic n=1 Tax=Rehmannia glutinosa TaxID=99300 RepID=A0ABR0XCR2_REHGL
MSHSVFQTAQIMPLAPTPNTLSSKSLLPTTTVFRHSVLPPAAGKLRKCYLTIKASSSAVVDGDAIASLERCFQASPDAPSSTPSCSADFGPVMKGQYGALGAVTLEKSKLDLTQKQTRSSPELSTGGGGGNMGKGLSHGGGDGGDDGGDDDDYFDNFDEGDEGDELFDRKFVDAVLNEWQKTIMDLPAGFRQAYEMVMLCFSFPFFMNWITSGLDSDANLALGFGQLCSNGEVSGHQRQTYNRKVHFSISSPRTVKSIYRQETYKSMMNHDDTRGCSSSVNGYYMLYNIFVERQDFILLIAFYCIWQLMDSLLWELLLEQATTIGCSVWWEIKNRKERIKQEWDLALINVLTVTACNAIVVWSLAPCRSYGNTFQFDLQNTLQKLPNNIFEKSYPLREFDFQKRLQSFFYKAAELCMVGFTAGAVQGAVSNLAASKKEGRLSVTTPSVSSNALGYGAFLGLYANLRYQLLCGLDRTVTSYFDVIGVALFFSTALRVMNVQLGETSRLAWLGVEVDPLAHSDDLLKAAYNRPSEGVDQSSSKWFISKNAIVSGLGLLGIRQGQTDSTMEGDAPLPKARRKRVVRRKVATS